MTNGAGERQGQDMNDDFGLSALREVLDLLKDSDISELKIERSGAKLHIRRGAPPAPAPTPFMITPSLAAALPQAIQPPLPPIAPFQQHVAGHTTPAETPEAIPHGQPITSPMVGTFYGAPSPKDPPYIQEGDTIQPGDRVGIVEAMKMMNEIEAEIGGRVARILVKNGQPVEYGQPLMIVEPS
jgi:acetyl-CoA carboxylase biotin carboxyl carrier protein